MRRLQFVASISIVIAALTTLAVFIGCEDEPTLAGSGDIFNNNDYPSSTRTDGEVPLLVTPIQESVTIVGQRIAFRAKGGSRPINWSVSSAARGKITSVGLRTDYAIYEVTSVADNTVQAIDADGRVAIASVRAGADVLQIIPGTVSLVLPSVGPALDFLVTGGVPPYSDWIESFPQLGVVSAGGTYVVMTDQLQGTNLITIVDAAGATASATVQHVLEYERLAIIPDSTSLEVNGDTAIFIASGGLPPYGWSVVYPSRGTILSGANSTIMEYRRDDKGSQIIILEDSLGNTDQAQVAQAAPTPPAIQPSNVTLASNELSYAFSVVGGTPPYSWLVLSGGGSVSPNTGTAVVYTRTAFTGNAILRVTDSASQSALATITQK